MKICQKCQMLNETSQNNCVQCNNKLSKKNRMVPFYCDTIVIALCFIFSFFIIPFIIGVGLLILQKIFYSSNIKAYEAGIDKVYHEKLKEAEKNAQEMIDAAQKELNETKKKCDELITRAKDEVEKKTNAGEQQVSYFMTEIQNLKQEKLSVERILADLRSEVTYATVYVDIDEEITSEEYRNRLCMLQAEEKQLIKNEEAFVINQIRDAKLQKQDAKQILRCFNSECSVIISNVTIKNVDSSRNKIIRSFDSINKIFVTDGVSISQKNLENKLSQLTAKYQYEYQKDQERLQQKAIREQMIEEEKARREIEREKEKLSKEETQFKNEIEKLMKYMQKSRDIEKQMYITQIEELQKKLAAVKNAKDDVLHREQNTRAGFVYIISNIGSFGENIYKIGMTRRLEPMDRISELSSASVPFEFDVHAMIFSDDAPALESILHNTFADKRLNLVNSRKEFFHVSLDEIEDVVKKNYNSTVIFTKIAEARQYRESLKLREGVSTR